jgi:hypothetical protein
MLSRMSQKENEEDGELVQIRPRKRSDCETGGFNEIRPCPFVSCRYHLYLTVNKRGEIKQNYLGDFDSKKHTCVLDVADETQANNEPMILEEVASYLGLTRERVRQIQKQAIRKIKR